MEHFVEVTHSGRVVRMAIFNKLTIEEYRDLGLELQKEMQKIKDPVHVIVDSAAMTSHPVSVSLLKQHSVWATETNFASLHHVSPNRFVTLIGDAVIGIMLKHYKAVSSLEEAYEGIYRMEPALKEFSL